MQYLPGTTVEVNENTTARGFLDSAFAMNGLVLSQVVQLTGLEPHTIQNWVKRKFVDPPQNKKYDMNQFCTITIINMLKDLFQNERIVSLLRYAEDGGREVNATLLYNVFCDVMDAVPEDAIRAQTDLDDIIAKHVKKLENVSAYAKERLEKVLKIMVVAYISARIRGMAELLLMSIEAEQ